MITDEFGITQAEMKAIEDQIKHLVNRGFNVPNVTIKMLTGQGMSGLSSIYINPNTNLQELKWAVTHEIGHHNEPNDFVTFDIWEGEKCKVENWKQEANKISKYATTNPHEFWAERFAQQYTIQE